MSEKSLPLTENQSLQVETAAAILKDGGIVAFPTETVYGLGADASNAKAIRRVFEAKQRPMNHPVIVHLSDFSQVEDWAMEVNAFAHELMAKFWPGPLTLVLRRTSRVLDEVTGGQDTVAIRMPANPIALTLLKKVERPLIAPSANRFGRVSPTHSDHVKQDPNLMVDFVVEGGRCQVGIESTIVDASSREPKILRLGGVTPEQIEGVTGQALAFKRDAFIRVPGSLAQHYAPQTRLSIVPSEDLAGNIQHGLSQGKSIVVLSWEKQLLGQEESITWFQMPAQPEAYMRELYHTLFMADALKKDIILVEALPNEAGWLAVRDRLERAAYL